MNVVAALCAGFVFGAFATVSFACGLTADDVIAPHHPAPIQYNWTCPADMDCVGPTPGPDDAIEDGDSVKETSVDGDFYDDDDMTAGML